ncbi:enoyl-CoA hydratase [Aeromicrobium sp. Root495]|uniref:enoyl-CoA hydratase-related protein n=1 Tax=Aeromicrobium sp. Root495 TaxID=1736550 RepID=UPI0006FDD646|nr:enoyl-CoA hydratase-related protein [Aeromicrobium sp. Root495]KQY56071.1 enoyl-CoA hydratase [Aeromicrobium sp. Root495]RYJ06231.1 MAG: enoyl-CoA hydratase [Actinomycetales bacterium]
MPLVLLESDGPVRTITLNAPDRLNALDWPLLEELKVAIAAVADDADARALVVTGAGRAFCSGADLENLFGDRTRPVEVLKDHLMGVYACFLGLRDLTIPTVASVHGPAVGAGLNIALACDVIVAGPKAGFGPTFAKIGLHPGGGCTWMLTQRIGAANTAAALYAGDLIGADDALRLGIAQWVDDSPLERATALAADYAGREPEVMAAIKQSVRLASTASAEESLAFEALAQARSLSSETFEKFAARFSR